MLRFHNDKICRDKNTAIVLPSFKLLEKTKGHFFTNKFIKVLGALRCAENIFLPLSSLRYYVALRCAAIDFFQH
jgi:hypothetical protein